MVKHVWYLYTWPLYYFGNDINPDKHDTQFSLLCLSVLHFSGFKLLLINHHNGMMLPKFVFLCLGWQWFVIIYMLHLKHQCMVKPA